MTDAAKRNDLICGVLVAMLGAFALWSSLGWDFGSPRRIGPGVFPAIVGAILICLGVGIALFERHPEGGGDDSIDSFNTRGFLMVMAALIAFTALVRSAGLLPAIWAAVLLSSRADDDARLPGTILVAVVMSAIAMGLFVYLLGFQARAFGAY